MLGCKRLIYIHNFPFHKKLIFAIQGQSRKSARTESCEIFLPHMQLFFLSIRVDFFIPGVPTVGGFTICSSHRLLKEKRSIDLAVKHSEHPPALWVHTQVCTEIWTLSWHRMPLLIRQTITVRPYRSD